MISKIGLIEGILFASTHAVKPAVIAELLEIEKEEVIGLIGVIQSRYESEDAGFHLVEVANGFQFRTKTDLREIMSKLNAKKPPRLTQATLEVLSIIAYKQPITRPVIEKMRGVDCTGVIKTLLERDLIEMRGRSDLPGNPVIYGTTQKFLEWFQIGALEQLPPLSEIEILSKDVGVEGSENLLNLMDKDEGFQASLTEVDETLASTGRITLDIPWEREETEDAAVAEAAALAGVSAVTETERPAEV